MAYTKDEVYQICQINADEAFKIQQARHGAWTTNYDLYRDTVSTNRLTQRQSVNIPLMKYVLKTALKEVDDLVDIYFRSNSNNKQKEIYLNAAWTEVVREQNLAIKDIVDKKQNMQYGRSTSNWNIDNGKIVFDLDDTFDVYFGRGTNPLDIDGSFRYLNQKHIYRPLVEMENDDRYDKAAIKKLKLYYSTEGGLVESAENTQALAEKNQRAADMGDVSVNNPQMGETVVEIDAHYIKLWNEEYQDMCIYYMESAVGIPLMFEEYENLIGVTKDHYWRTHTLKSSWGDDVERNDMYSDGLCDMIRPINIIVNSWFSQDVENRTLANYNMHYYDSGLDGFVPQAYEARPWGWYGIPLKSGQKMDDVFKTVDVQPLQDTLPAIQWAIGIAEKAAATSTTQSGQANASKVTLGEVQLVLQEAKDRVKSMSKYYFPAWVDRATKWLKLIEAAGSKLDSMKLYKKSYKGNMFAKEISPDDWYDEDGYTIEITSRSEMKAKALENLTVLNAVKQSMPLNAPLQDIYEQKMLDLLQDVTPEQIKQVMDFQKELRNRGILDQMNPMMAAGGQGGRPMPGNGQKLIAPGGAPAPMPAQ